jgi:rare lipoprotein A
MRRTLAARAVCVIAIAIAIAIASATVAFAEPKSAAAAPAPETSAASAGDAGSSQTGLASWYGADFHGKRTSNGEIYDKEKLTCAHRTLSFGSYVLVRNLDNGSSVVVRVNDRGPFAKERIIDLSEAAARIIGMIPTGTARVSLTVIPREEALAWKGGALDGAASALDGANRAEESKGPAPEAAPAASVPTNARVRIQVASYASAANAKATVARLAASGLVASLESSLGRYRVLFPDLSPEEARVVSIRLDGLGYRGYVVSVIRDADGN